MAWDPRQQNIVMFGGGNGMWALDDTWVWNGSNWIQMSPSTKPQARFGHGMAFDGLTSTKGVALYGGVNSAAQYFDDVWYWNGSNWQNLTRSSYKLPARAGVAYALTPSDHAAAIGGGGPSGLLDGHWIVEGGYWEKWVGGVPTNRANASAARDDARMQTILFGGNNSSGVLGDTWAFDGMSWKQIYPSGSPAARRYHAMAHDQVNRVTVLFGGTTSSGSTLSDTWTLGEATAGALADLVVENLRMTDASLVPITSPQPGQDVRFLWTLANRGTAAATVSSVHLSAYRDGQLYDSGFLSIPIQPGAVKEQRTTEPWILTAGAHNFRVFVDDTNLLPESSDANNVVSFDFTVGAPALPDLTIENLRMVDASGANVSSPQAGQAVYFDMTLANRGAGSVPVSTVHVTAYKDGQAYQAATVGVPQAPGATLPLRTTEAWILTPGPHAFRIEIDDTSAVVESNESNNLSSYPFSAAAACTLTCTANMPSTAPAGTPISFSATEARSNCASGAAAFSWSFGDGGNQASASGTKTYSAPGTYGWRLTVNAPGAPTCEKSGTIVVTASESCVNTGGLKLCADSVVESPMNTFTLKGRVNFNKILWMDGDAKFVRQFESSGVFSGTGALRVSRDSGPTGPVILDAATVSGLKFDVSGAGADGCAYGNGLRPAPIPGAYSLTLGGMVLTGGGDGTIKPRCDGVLFDSLVSIGPSNFSLAKISLGVLARPEAPFLELKSVQGTFGPENSFLQSILSFGDVRFGYEPGENKLSVDADIRFGKINDIDFLKVGLGLRNGAIDRAKLGFPTSLKIPPYYFELSGLTFEVSNISEPSKLTIFGAADLACVPCGKIRLGASTLPILELQEVGLTIDLAGPVTFHGGRGMLLGQEIGSLEAKLDLSAGHQSFSLDGVIDLFGLLHGSVSVLLDPSRPEFSGRLYAGLRIPSIQCGTFDGFCQSLRFLLESGFGPLPYDLAASETSVWVGKGGNGSWIASFKRSGSVLGITIAQEVGYWDEAVHLKIGWNLIDMYQVFKPWRESGPHSVEQRINLPAPSGVVFSAVSRPGKPAPAITLTTPSGKQITPANPSDYPNTRYFGNASQAMFVVPGAEAGNWTLSSSNLSSGEVDLYALVPQAPPVTAFSHVQFDGRWATFTARVTPASAATSTSFFVSRRKGEWGGLVVVPPQTAASGSVGGTWDTTGFPAGDYYLGARTDDGVNPSSFVSYPSPIRVGGVSSLAAPSNLHGTRDGGTVRLSWDPSPSAVGYLVRYTDEVAEAGFRNETTVLSTTSKTLSGLDANRPYRFTVAAFDRSGAYSVDSPSLSFGSSKAMLLSKGRVKVTVWYRNQYSGQTGDALTIPQGDGFGYFYFSDPGNPEVFVKVLDFGSTSPYLLFYAGLTDFEYRVTYANLETGKSVTFTKPAGSLNGWGDNTSLPHVSMDGGLWDGVSEEVAPLPPSLLKSAGGSENIAFWPLPEAQRDPADAGEPGPLGAELLLSRGTVAVTVSYRNQYSGASGTALALPQGDQFGFFYFSDPGNPEVFVKVLDWGADRPYLIFFAGLTDFEYTVSFRQTKSGQVVSFKKSAGTYNGGADNTSLKHP
ncbi:MAG: hypothetical protein DIJKHBIC_04546 [Thermoanaerobaculia bacterium]|nr:hypothetical protein [Thermoanaerobaculia bacterium]